MAFSMSSFLLVSLSVLLLFCSLEKSFAFQTRKEAIERNHDPQYSHLVQLSSLLPSSICSSSIKESNSGAKRKASLEVVHKHGPCSQLKHDEAKAQSHSDILSLDQERVKYIHSRLSKNLGQDESLELDSASLPAKSGSLIGSGNYFVVVGLGTPKRDLSLVFDTASDLTWTQCEPCARYCYKQQDPIFDPSKSSSYSNISCTTSVCTQLTSATGNDPGCASSSKACIYGIQYGDSSFSVGYFSRERLTVTSTDIINNYLFGCGQNNRGLFNGAAGLLGLGRHPISFVQQTSLKYHQIFSYCLPSRSSLVGYLAFGAAPGASKYLKYTPFSTISRSSSFYGLDIEGINVGGKNLPVSSSTFSTGGAIIDSGTVISRLPPTAYDALKAAFRQGMSQYPAAGALSILDTCYDLSGYKEVSIPKISFVFGHGVTVPLAAVGTLYAVSEKQVCLAFAANEDDSAITIFGNVQQKTLEVVYDVGRGRLGFGVGGCD